MSMHTAAVLETAQGGRILLQKVDVEGHLHDLMSDIAITQTYKNKEPVTIEGVYTFPLPLDAVLLELTVTLGERTLAGHVVAKAEAEERYEEAITDGDAAIMLQQVEPGLYTMNVGNLKPGETVVIRFRYAVLQRWNGEQLRFMLPTTIAPRYGDPGAAGLAPHQQPEYDIVAELFYALRLRISGLLADSHIESPSHPISVERGDGEALVELARGVASLDRDFVLNFHLLEGGEATASFDRDLNGYVALASFKPEFGPTRCDTPRHLTLVIDCSGSMGGDSIALARMALLRILDSLRPQDCFDILAFGNHYKGLFGRQMDASGRNLDQARGFVRGLDADMGGTEIGGALQAAYQIGRESDAPRDLLLITDGEVWNYENILQQAQQSGHRIFTVGVGSAVAEGFVRQLAEATGGACELVSPTENMADKIHRHFQRMYSPCTDSVRLDWPVDPVACFPETPGPIYEGDTFHAFAWFDTPPEGDVTLEIVLPGGKRVSQQAEISPILNHAEHATATKVPPTLSRMAAGTKLLSVDDADKGTTLATDYQLMSPWTNYLVIDVRAEADKAGDLPTLRKVPQMLAAGWGGMGAVDPHDLEYLDIPVFLKSSEDTQTTRGPSEFVEKINAMPQKRFVPKLKVNTVESLKAAGLPKHVTDILQGVIESGNEETEVVICFLYFLATSEVGQLLSREAQRAIRKAFKDTAPRPQRIAIVKDALSGIELWNVITLPAV